MALTKEEIVDRIEIVESGIIQIRTTTVIKEDGVEIARTYHRSCVEPGDVVQNEASRVQAVAQAVWTKDVIDKYKAEKDAKRGG